MSGSREEELRRLFRGFQSLFQPSGKVQQQRAFPLEWHVGRFVLAMVTPLTVWAALTYLEHKLEGSPKPFSRALEHAENNSGHTQGQAKTRVEQPSADEGQQQLQQSRPQATLEQVHQLRDQQQSQLDARLRTVEVKLDHLLVSLQTPSALAAQRDRQQQDKEEKRKDDARQRESDHKQAQEQQQQQQQQQQSATTSELTPEQARAGQQQGGLRNVADPSQEADAGTSKNSSAEAATR